MNERDISHISRRLNGIIARDTARHSGMNLARAADFLPKCLPTRPAPVLGGGMPPTILTHLSDPGHGWLVVPEALARDVMGRHNPAGIGLFSPCSFRVPTASGPVLLLEEDCDASLFLAEWKDQPGFGPVTVAGVECPDSIDVRSLPRLPARTTTEEDLAASLLENAYRKAEEAARAADFSRATGEREDNGDQRERTGFDG